jgi:RimJ/RimL family protein N-acetyltransferase
VIDVPAPEGYVVRAFTSGDAASFLAAVRASLPALAHEMPWCREDYALEDAAAWMAFTQAAWAKGSEFPLGIFEAGSGAVVGGTGINQVNRVHRTGNIGYWVSTPHRGRGVARLAVRQAAILGFEERGFTRLEIVVLPSNVASQRVAEALGATLECTARNRLHVHGRAQDALVYSLTPDDAARWRVG